MFYYDVQAVLSRFVHDGSELKYMQYSEFDEIEEIGSGGYGTVYTATHESFDQRVALKCFKNFARAPELFISEASMLSIVF